MTRAQLCNRVFQFILTTAVFTGIAYGIKYDMFTQEYIAQYIHDNGYMALLANVVIAFFGIPAIYLSQSLNFNTRRWASVLGLTAQPFWYAMAIHSEAWGVFIMSFFYTHAWWTGFVKYWLEPEPIKS